ncbi:hypothetical protein [Stutzerimonas nitrititolerans]|uniref:hypothetical protein n=1 Tax=Stutzerimonas nitrititolerans TaxID=2482751 RepID=UPI0028A5A2BB|nr:hypothetical protein [Stutzerimonas nitrititolerans]
MNTDTHRVERLKLWLDEFDGKIAAFCRHYGLSRTRASYLSQLLSGNRPLGERAARKLEAECNRPNGWLDMSNSEPQKLKYDAARFGQLPQADRELVEGFIEFVLQRWERRAVSSTKAAPLSMSEDYVPPAQQIEAMQMANRKPRKNAEHGKKTSRNRNAA